MTVAIISTHPYADKFPMLGEADYIELRESIRANGLRQPPVVTPDGQLIDGRNRHRAAQELGLSYQPEVYDGDDIAEYVIDCNSSRRHMSTGARAMSTALVLAADGRRKDGRWKRGSVDVGNTESRNTWQDALRQCGIVIDHAPELAEQVANGELALDAALRRAEQVRDEDRRRLEAEERIAAEESDALAALPGDWRQQVGTTYSSARVAFAAWEDENRAEAARLRQAKDAEQRKAAEVAKSQTEYAARLGSLCSSLDALTYPKQREMHREAFRAHPEGATPTARKLVSANDFRRYAEALTTLATEWEQQ